MRALKESKQKKKKKKSVYVNHLTDNQFYIADNKLSRAERRRERGIDDVGEFPDSRLIENYSLVTRIKGRILVQAHRK